MERKQGVHKFFDKHTLAGLIILMFGGMLLAQIIIGGLLGFLLSKAGIGLKTGIALGASIGGILIVFLHFFRFSPEYRWKSGKEDFLNTFRLLSPFLIFWITYIPIDTYCAGRFPFGPVAPASLAAALSAGICEEAAFRELPISYMARQWKEGKYIPAMVLIPGVAFGLIHLSNGIMGSRDIVGLLLQAGFSIFFGIFFSAVYLRTGCIWPLMFTHALHDILVFSAAYYVDDLPDGVAVVWLIIEGGLAMYGFYLIRKSKRAEILAFWDKKWSRT